MSRTVWIRSTHGSAEPSVKSSCSGAVARAKPVCATSCRTMHRLRQLRRLRSELWDVAVSHVATLLSTTSTTSTSGHITTITITTITTITTAGRIFDTTRRPTMCVVVGYKK
ncbi:hypothetical protein BZA05DRAFT_445873 [Tricharina praecox]|uniref:uncharacterized protein n=1 Tax=Tricharina praecox TaxID=43433 RepID=UPI00221F4F71|nr:uncharacterized protein BZA05DRAFT_445873 [Tricharina praecox]KAI5849682.1 hypothetical protein BZA05DRAFT_445873 [Tricharina praecox]